MGINCIPETLSNAFYSYGKFVARHPLPFIIVPVCVSVCLMVGMINMTPTSDAEYLYVPIDAPAKDERSYFRDTFLWDDHTHFTSMRRVDIEGFVQIHISPKRGSNVLNDDVIDAIKTLNSYVLSYTVRYSGQRYGYEDLCARWNGSCTYSGFLDIVGNNSISDLDINYPFHTHVDTGEVINLVQQVGGVEYPNGVLQSARAILMSYNVRTQSSSDEKRSEEWLNSLRDELFDYKDSRIKIEFQTSLSLNQELEDSLGSIIILFVIAYNALYIFAVLFCLMSDWVRSKPWVALGGCTAAGLGIGSSMGLMSAAGVKFASIVGTMPFLIIGIGLDDMFILVSAWRYTSFHQSVEERLGQTLKNAAVSITITSVTDALAFGIGCLTPFRSVTIYCAYTGVAVSFVYIYMITFTAACLVYSGRREAANRHPFTCKKVLPKSQAGHKSGAYQIFCTGGVEADSEKQNGAGHAVEMTTSESKTPLPGAADDNTDASATADVTPTAEQLEEQGIKLPWLNIFLGSTYADFIMKTPVKIGIVLVYLALLSGTVYGILTLEEGLDRADLAPDDSYFQDFFAAYKDDFLEIYGPIVMVGVDETLDYTQQSVRNDIEELITEFRENKFFVTSEDFVISWLDRYVNFLTDELSVDVNTLTMPAFIEILQEQFFAQEAYQYHRSDVVISADNTSITASRFFVQTGALEDAVDERDMMLDARDIADDSKLDVEVFTSPFVFYDQYVVIFSTTLQNLGIAVASMLVVSLVLIPSLTTVFWVTMATVSICSCVIGYMSLWDVSLDSVSMINLVMCIGFSVDFAAHISYHFVMSASKDAHARARDALGYLGTPIVQGAVTTILSVLALSSSNTYIFRTFFKLVFLVMLFGFFHAMCLLPVLLSTLSCRQCKKSASVSDSREATPVHTATTTTSASNHAEKYAFDNPTKATSP